MGVGPLLVEDLAGSLWEWTHDWYGEATYSKSTNKQHRSPETGDRRVIRGGGWMDKDPADLRVTGRAALPPEAQMSDVGFRCARPAEPLR